MSRIDQTSDELKQHLKEQINFINKSSRDFDNGDISEAKRIATHIRVLVHDTKNSVSILNSLGEKEIIPFLDSSLPNRPNNLMPYTGLVYLRVVNDSKGFRAKYSPLLNSRPKNWLSFDNWWDGIIITDQEGNRFSRKKLVLHVADTDGGAYADKLYLDYFSLSRANSIGFSIVVQRGNEVAQENPVKNIEFASIRQIAFELVESLTRHYAF
jgi:hypothetical protein